MDKVSVIIPTYNRFDYLLNAINSVKNQTYKNIEIIVINDCSTQKEYYEHNWDGIQIIHLPENSKSKFGFTCSAHVRNEGIKKSSGNYIAFLDDDDSWFSKKIELQIKAMKETGCKMSCTEGLFGFGIYNNDKHYQKFNFEKYYHDLKNIYRNKGSILLKNGFPDIWNLDFLKVHNCCICSSVVIEKSILEKINYMKCIKPPEDYDCWLRTLEHTDCVYIKDICVYYDGGHGYGQNY